MEISTFRGLRVAPWQIHLGTTWAAIQLCKQLQRYSWVMTFSGYFHFSAILRDSAPDVSAFRPILFLALCQVCHLHTVWSVPRLEESPKSVTVIAWEYRPCRTMNSACVVWAHDAILAQNCTALNDNHAVIQLGRKQWGIPEATRASCVQGNNSN